MSGIPHIHVHDHVQLGKNAEAVTSTTDFLTFNFWHQFLSHISVEGILNQADAVHDKKVHIEQLWPG